jgi:hypothetical protein
MGSLACLAAGFEIVARHPILIVVPLLLDLFLWLGPRLSIAPPLMALERQMNVLFAMSGDLPEMQEARLLTAQLLEELATRYNLFAALRPAPLLGVPTLMANRLTLARPFGLRPDWIIGSWWGAAGVQIVLAALGLGLSALYLRWVGRHVIGETEAPLPGPGPLGTTWGRFVQFTLILIIALLGLSAAIFSFVVFIGLISLGLAGLAMTVMFSFLVFIGFHLVFVIPGIIQLRRAPPRAIRESFLLARGGFLNVSFLILLILVISRGLNFVWALPDPATWAMVVGIGGHAFVSTALTAALFVFYQERLGLLKIMEQIQSPDAAAHPLMGE